jgi:hypothetical protein
MATKTYGKLGGGYSEEQVAMMERNMPEGAIPGGAFNFRSQFIPPPPAPDTFKTEDLPPDLQPHDPFEVRYIDRDTKQGAYVKFEDALNVPKELAEDVQFMAAFAEQAVTRAIEPNTELFVEVLGMLIQGIGNTLYRSVQDIASVMEVFGKSGKYGAMKHSSIYRTQDNRLVVIERAY